MIELFLETTKICLFLRHLDPCQPKRTLFVLNIYLIAIIADFVTKMPDGFFKKISWETPHLVTAF